MKLTNKQLRQIIKEELENVLGEGEGHHFRSGDPMSANYPVVFTDQKNYDKIRIKYGSIDKMITSAQYNKYGNVRNNPDDTINMLVKAYGIKPEEAKRFKWFADAKGRYFEG